MKKPYILASILLATTLLPVLTFATSDDAWTISVTGATISAPASDSTTSSDSGSSLSIDTGTWTITLPGVTQALADTAIIVNETVPVDSWVVTTPVVATPAQTSTVVTGDEFSQGLQWMYQNNITIYGTAADYRPDDYINREEAAKLITNTSLALGFSSSIKNNDCEFLDLSGANIGLVYNIKQACEVGLFAGYQHNFMPKNIFSTAQAITVFVKMLEGDEASGVATNPRWINYYRKGRAVGITNDTGVANFDRPITRREIAIRIRRIKGLADTASKRTALQQQLQSITQTQTTSSGSVNTASLNLANDTDFQEAFYRMEDNGMVADTNINNFQAFDKVTREEAAQYIYKFAQSVNYTDKGDGNYDCNFTDLDQADTDYQAAITQTCKLGLFAGKDGIFAPKQNITKAEFFVLLVKMLDGKALSDNATPRRQGYFVRGQDLGLVSISEYATFADPMSQIDLALTLYKFNIRYKMTANLNNGRVKDEIITTAEIDSGADNASGTSDPTSGKIYIDTNLLNDQNFDIGFVDLFGYKYKVVKTTIDTYFTDNFVRYGDLYDIIDDSKVGTIQFIVSNGYVIEGTIRMWNPNPALYDIQGSNTTEALYTMTKKAR